ncbi:MAG: hypothetical protein E4H28_08125, partial [Gemmatimonadales bacterium]
MGTLRWRHITFLILVSLILSSCNGLDMILARVRGLCRDEIIVTKVEDTNRICTTDDCSLREAISLSNACPGLQTVHIPEGTYALDSERCLPECRSYPAEISISSTVNLEGQSGPVVIVGLVLRIDRTAGDVNLSDFTLTHSYSSWGVPTEGATVFIANGASVTMTHVTIEHSSPAIHNFGNLVFQRGIIRDNQNASTVGGLWNDGDGNATIQDSLVEGNRSDDGPGGIRQSGASLIIIRSTIRGNESRIGAAGLSVEPPRSSDAPPSVTSVIDSTFTGNRGVAVSVWSGTGRLPVDFVNTTISGNSQGVSVGGRLRLRNVTIARNEGAGLALGYEDSEIEAEDTIVADNGGGNCLNDAGSAGTIRSLGYNLDTDGTCGFSGPGDLSGLEAELAPLADNGGSTWTHALRVNSPAVDAGGPGCADADQRGIARPSGAGCDIGSYELRLLFDVPPAGGPIPGLVPTPPLSPTLPIPTPTSPPQPVSAPLATFIQTGNCRSGPGGIYGVVTSYPQGTQVTLEGQNADGTWWWVLMPGIGGHCFASGSVLDLEGSMDSLPIIAAPPTPTTEPTATEVPQAPAAPGKLSITNQVCTSQAYSVTL